MKIGIDISQIAYEKTGVASFVKNLVENMIEKDRENEYILFYSSLRKTLLLSVFNFPSNTNVSIKTAKIPPTLLDLLWNRLHILPIEWLIGDVDVFISSDWTEPPTKRAKKVTILYDLVIYKFPKETDSKIIATQKRKLYWTKKECDAILCISESTKRDAIEIFDIPENRLKVIYPGVSL
jgi:glycosyltransferase involved in cell wall biosynthesis